MISLYIDKFEVTKSEGPVVTFRMGSDLKDTHEFKIKVPTYDMKVWAESVGCQVYLDPKILANQDSVLLDDPDQKGELRKGSPE